MKKRIALIIALVALAAITSGSNPAAVRAASADLNGTWAGTATVKVAEDTITGRMTWTLRRSGDDVTGTWSLVGDSGETFSGTVAGGVNRGTTDQEVGHGANLAFTLTFKKGWREYAAGSVLLESDLSTLRGGYASVFIPSGSREVIFAEFDLRRQ